MISLLGLFWSIQYLKELQLTRLELHDAPLQHSRKPIVASFIGDSYRHFMIILASVAGEHLEDACCASHII